MKNLDVTVQRTDDGIIVKGFDLQPGEEGVVNVMKELLDSFTILVRSSGCEVIGTIERPVEPRDVRVVVWRPYSAVTDACLRSWPTAGAVT